MIVEKTKLPGILIVKPNVFDDQRGYFKELFHLAKYSENQINYNFVQDNFSKSQKNVLRGLHFQNKKPQGKLVSCLKGSVFDVAVDINPKSKTFKEYVSVELSAENHKQIWIPPGYAHGFCVLSEMADFQYKCTDYYDPLDEGGILWNDPDLAIKWPITKPILSKKDKAFPKFNNLFKN